MSIDYFNALIEKLNYTIDKEENKIIIYAENPETEDKIRDILSKETGINKDLIGEYYNEHKELLNENYMFKIHYKIKKEKFPYCIIESIETKFAVFAAILIAPMSTGTVEKVKIPIVNRNADGKEELLKYISGKNVPVKFLIETDNTAYNAKLNFILKDKPNLSNKIKMLVMSAVNRLSDEVNN